MTPDLPLAPLPRFTLDEDRARAWLDYAVAFTEAYGVGAPAPPLPCGVRPGIEIPDILRTWSPRENADGVDDDVVTLVRAAVQAGIITALPRTSDGPPQLDDLEFLSCDDRDTYRFAVRIGPSAQLVTLPEEMRKIGEPGATGAAPALAILRDAAAAANQLIGALYGSIAAQAAARPRDLAGVPPVDQLRQAVAAGGWYITDSEARRLLELLDQPLTYCGLLVTLEGLGTFPCIVADDGSPGAHPGDCVTAPERAGIWPAAPA